LNVFALNKPFFAKRVINAVLIYHTRCEPQYREGAPSRLYCALTFGFFSQGGLIMPRALLIAAIVCVTAFSVFSQTRPRASATPELKNDTPRSNQNKPPAIKNQKVPAVSNKPAKEEDGVVYVDTNLITTPVSVLDRQGRFIPGLKKKDFKIYEDGVLQTIDTFISSEMPFTVILMLDVSPSTRYRLDDIHYAAITFINQLRPTDRVMVVAFDQRVHILAEPTTDRKELFGAIYKAQFGSGTSLYDAVDAVSNLELVTSPGRKAIVMFTDGVDTTSRRATVESTVAGVEELDALIYPIRYNTQQANAMPNMGIDPAIFAQLPQAARDLIARGTIRANVGRGQSAEEYARGKSYLEALAATSGGRIFDADSIENMEASFSNVAEELRRQYSVGYYSNKEGQPGDRKHIKVTVARPGSVVRAKTTYIVKEKESAEPTVSGSNGNK
jgi:VWFA-related protein